MDENTTDTIAQLAAALDGHQVTGDEGQIAEETTFVGEPATSEQQTPVEDSTGPEKAAEAPVTAPKAETGDSEQELVEDESGKRYVPQKRFDQVYKQAKEYERRFGPLTEAQRQGQAPLPPVPQPLPQPAPIPRPAPVDKTEQLDVELLIGTLPQFNPDSEDYSRVLDEMGFEIYQSNPGISRLEAARRALKRARELSRAEATVKIEARSVKAQQSDQGITSRVLNREREQPNPENMTLEQMEEYLKANGQW